MYRIQHIEQNTERRFAAVAAEPLLSEVALPEPRGTLREQVQDYIAANLHRAISPAEILQVFPCSRPTLYRLFGADGGLVSYIRTCRLREAAIILVQLPFQGIVDIAYYVGYGSASDFSRAFRRSFGISPSAYRRACLLARCHDVTPASATGISSVGLLKQSDQALPASALQNQGMLGFAA